MSWLAVGLGGAIGAVLRHGLATMVVRSWPSAPAPTAIFLINVLGSAAIGVVAGLIATSRVTMGHDIRLFITVGLLGGFTTFSSFSLDTLVLLRSGHVSMAMLNAAGQVIVGLAAAALGYRLSH
jgi:CrcB protein